MNMAVLLHHFAIDDIYSFDLVVFLEEEKATDYRVASNAEERPFAFSTNSSSITH